MKTILVLNIACRVCQQLEVVKLLPSLPYDCAVIIELYLDGSTHGCAARVCAGGVGRNIAEALWRLRNRRARLLTAVGDDADGRYLTDIAPGLILDGCVVPGGRTASYAAVLDDHGECRLGLGDMEIHGHITPQLVDKHKDALEKAPLIVFDGNLPQSTVDHLLQLCHQMKKPVFFEPTDRRKAVKPLVSQSGTTYASPNLAELRAMASYIEPKLDLKAITEVDEILRLSEIVVQFIGFLVVTMGSKGVLTICKNCSNNVTAKLYPVKALKSTVNVSGAGDCFASGFMHGILSGLDESKCITAGFYSAKSALLSENTVPSNMNINITNMTNATFKQL